MATPQTYTKIKIISLALTFLGKGPINSLADGGEFADSAGDIYDLLFPTLITSGDWRFAVTTQELSQNITAPEIDDWDYSWQLPADFLGLIRLSPHINYNIFGQNLYTKTTASNLYAIYYYQPEPETLPPYFVIYLAYKIAADLAWSSARSKTTAEAFEKKTIVALQHGQSIDARNHPNIAIGSAPYVEVRNVGAKRPYRGDQ